MSSILLYLFMLRITINRLFVFCILSLLSSNFSSQTHSIRFNRLGINDGLSQSTINCILQDNDGYIWVSLLRTFVKTLLNGVKKY